MRPGVREGSRDTEGNNSASGIETLLGTHRHSQSVGRSSGRPLRPIAPMCILQELCSRRPMAGSEVTRATVSPDMERSAGWKGEEWHHCIRDPEWLFGLRSVWYCFFRDTADPARHLGSWFLSLTPTPRQVHASCLRLCVSWGRVPETLELCRSD